MRPRVAQPNSLTTWTNVTNSQFSSFSIWVWCRWLTFGLLRIQCIHITFHFSLFFLFSLPTSFSLSLSLCISSFYLYCAVQCYNACQYLPLCVCVHKSRRMALCIFVFQWDTGINSSLRLVSKLSTFMWCCFSSFIFRFILLVLFFTFI